MELLSLFLVGPTGLVRSVQDMQKRVEIMGSAVPVKLQVPTMIGIIQENLVKRL